MDFGTGRGAPLLSEDMLSCDEDLFTPAATAVDVLGAGLPGSCAGSTSEANDCVLSLSDTGAGCCSGIATLR